MKVEVGIAKSCRNDGKPATSTECPVDKNTVPAWFKFAYRIAIII